MESMERARNKLSALLSVTVNVQFGGGQAGKMCE